MPDADRAPSFQSFLEDLNYTFAEKLMDFCLQHSADSSWEHFSKKNQFIFTAQGPFGKSAVRFTRKFSRIWLPLKKGSDFDESIAEFQSDFQDELEIDVQDGVSMRAIYVVIDTERKCDDLIKWLGQASSGQPRKFMNKPTRELVEAFFEWFRSDNHSEKEDVYAETVTYEHLSKLDREEFIEFFFQFAWSGGKLQTGGARTASGFRKTITEKFEEFRAFALEPFGEEFDEFLLFQPGYPLKAPLLGHCLKLGNGAFA